jgi:hypothetical protein
MADSFLPVEETVMLILNGYAISAASFYLLELIVDELECTVNCHALEVS